jgi:hypothetical protein
VRSLSYASFFAFKSITPFRTIATKKTGKGFVAERIIPFISKKVTNNPRSLPKPIGKHHRFLKDLAIQARKLNTILGNLSEQCFEPLHRRMVLTV